MNSSGPVRDGGDSAEPADGQRSGEGAATALEALIRKRREAGTPADPLDPPFPDCEQPPMPPLPPALTASP